jgi:hypothetical protein
LHRHPMSANIQQPMCAVPCHMLARTWCLRMALRLVRTSAGLRGTAMSICSPGRAGHALSAIRAGGRPMPMHNTGAPSSVLRLSPSTSAGCSQHSAYYVPGTETSGTQAALPCTPTCSTPHSCHAPRYSHTRHDAIQGARSRRRRSASSTAARQVRCVPWGSANRMAAGSNNSEGWDAKGCCVQAATRRLW